MAGSDPFRDFFTFSSGVDRHILELCPDGEQKKYRNIGAIVALTAIFAFVSGSYALYTIFDKLSIAIGFGLLWGVMIYALDRYLVASMKKLWPKPTKELSAQSNENGQKHANEDKSFFDEDKSREWWQAFPRIILALIIAVVISKPLEMKIFEKEINQVISEEKNQLRLDAQEQIGKLYSPQNKELDEDINRLRAEIAEKTERTQKLYESYITEAEGTSGTGLRGKGPVYQDKKSQYDLSVLDLQSTQLRNSNAIDSLQNIQNKLALEYQSSLDEAEPYIEDVDGLMARIAALNKLGDQNGHLPSIFIMLLFMAVEMAPILAKLLSGVGHYDKEVLHFEIHKQIMIEDDIRAGIPRELEEQHTFETDVDPIVQGVAEKASNSGISNDNVTTNTEKEDTPKRTEEDRFHSRLARQGFSREFRERVVAKRLKYDIKLISKTFLVEREIELNVLHNQKKAQKEELKVYQLKHEGELNILQSELEMEKSKKTAELEMLESELEIEKSKKEKELDRIKAEYEAEFAFEKERFEQEQRLESQKTEAEMKAKENAEERKRKQLERELESEIETQKRREAIEQKKLELDLLKNQQTREQKADLDEHKNRSEHAPKDTDDLAEESETV